MSRNGHRDNSFYLSEKEVIQRARRSTDLHYRHDRSLDLDAARVELQTRIPIEAPPPQSRLRQARASISFAVRHVPWDWRALFRNPLWFGLGVFVFPVVTFVVVILVCLNGHPHAQQAAETVRKDLPRPSATAHRAVHPGPAEDHPAKVPSARSKRQADEDGSQDQPPPQVADRPPAAIDVTIGARVGSVLSVGVTLSGAGSQGTWQAGLDLAVDPATAVCSLTGLSSGSPGLAQLLAALTAPVAVTVHTSSGRPLQVEIMRTGIPAQPLSCTVPDSAPTAAPTDAGRATSLPGTLGNVIGSATSVPLLQPLGNS
ncbi:MAG TPA: hypothetical protein VN847_18560 [Streptosporangiaceae bacterium]|nr:hypothetical protein [Streptosporangiaceae bacterium]